MEFVKKYALAIFLSILGLGFIVVLTLTLFKPPAPKDGANANKSQTVTTLNSPFAGASDSLTVNYGGDADPNTDAVKQRFKIFALSKVPVDNAIRQDLDSILPELVGREVIPTYALTYIHINPASVKCDALNNCSMLIYIDSPETLFELKTDYTQGIPAFTLTQKPWKGIQNGQ